MNLKLIRYVKVEIFIIFRGVIVLLLLFDFFCGCIIGFFSLLCFTWWSSTLTKLIFLLSFLYDRGHSLIDFYDSLAFILDLLEALCDFLGHFPDEDEAVVGCRDQVLHVVGEAHCSSDLTRLGPAKWRTCGRLVDGDSL